MELEELRMYPQSMEIADRIREQVSDWGFVAKDTLGKQWVRASDSLSANLSEGYGRYHFRENRNFLFYARGSLRETRTWLRKARNRQLIPETFYQEIEQDLKALDPQLNSYIRSIGNKDDTERETDASYGSSFEKEVFSMDQPSPDFDHSVIRLRLPATAGQAND